MNWIESLIENGEIARDGAFHNAYKSIDPNKNYRSDNGKVYTGRQVLEQVEALGPVASVLILVDAKETVER